MPMITLNRMMTSIIINGDKEGGNGYTRITNKICVENSEWV